MMKRDNQCSPLFIIFLKNNGSLLFNTQNFRLEVISQGVIPRQRFPECYLKSQIILSI